MQIILFLVDIFCVFYLNNLTLLTAFFLSPDKNLRPVLVFAYFLLIDYLLQYDLPLGTLGLTVYSLYFILTALRKFLFLKTIYVWYSCLSLTLILKWIITFKFSVFELVNFIPWLKLSEGERSKL